MLIVILVTKPETTVARPILVIPAAPRLSVCIPTETVWMPDLYPEPLLPIETEVIVPANDTTAVPPADTSGW